MKKIFFSIGCFIVLIAGTTAQRTEIECTIYKKSAGHLTLKPAHYDIETIPAAGDQVMLSVYLKENLPVGKEEGYYELFMIETTRLIPGARSILFKAEQNMDAAKTKHGINDIQLTTGSRVKISWNH
jgi:hypothetical protein